MTATSATIVGPLPIPLDELPALNALFSEAFSERYRRDGMTGVRVPPLNPSIWRFAIECAGEGAMLWRDGTGAIAAFNLAHVSGREGWMGPLAVRDELQGQGLGQTIVRAGLDHLQRAGCTRIGLETMPRTMENIGFYARLGFVPAPLTITVTLDGFVGDRDRPELLSSHGESARGEIVRECAQLSGRVLAGADFSRELTLTVRHGLGDALLLRAPDASLRGFALFHDVPLVEGRSREELRALKVVLADASDIVAITDALRAQARRSGTMRVAIRMQGEYGAEFAALVRAGARVRWTDLRMVLGAGAPATRGPGLVLSNWEI